VRLEPARSPAPRRARDDEAATDSVAPVMRWADDHAVRSEAALESPPPRPPLPPAVVLAPSRRQVVDRSRMPEPQRPMVLPPVTLRPPEVQRVAREAPVPSVDLVQPEGPARRGIDREVLGAPASLWPRLPDEDELEVAPGREGAWPALAEEDDLIPLDEPRLRDDRERLDRLRGEQRGMRWSERRS
jgi:hypothetical protein